RVLTVIRHLAVGMTLHPLHYISLYRLILVSTDPPRTALYTLSLHDALPISSANWDVQETRNTDSWAPDCAQAFKEAVARATASLDRKSTRLNSSHEWISYAVFCLKKKKKRKRRRETGDEQISSHGQGRDAQR